ncbi:hypothetical protein [Pseudomonas sp. F01002]
MFSTMLEQVVAKAPAQVSRMLRCSVTV